MAHTPRDRPECPDTEPNRARRPKKLCAVVESVQKVWGVRKSQSECQDDCQGEVESKSGGDCAKCGLECDKCGGTENVRVLLVVLVGGWWRGGGANDGGGSGDGPGCLVCEENEWESASKGW